MYDLVLHGGRLIDPAQGLDGRYDVAFRDGRVAAVAPEIPKETARAARDVSGLLVVPGLIDLHTHVYWGGTALGVDAEGIARRSGTTTFVDAGSAGAGNLLGFRKHVIEPAKPRILAYINVSFPGIYAFSREVMAGECEDVRLLNAQACLRAAREHADIVVGVKARVGRNAGGSSGLYPLEIAIEVAEELGLPVMAHIDFPPPGIRQVLSTLRPGDVITHCCRSFPNAPIDRHARVRPEVLAARERGVVLDIGHGYGGFAFSSGRAMLAEGVMPDVISSDVHVLSVDGPAYDVLAVMSKFLCLGVDLVEVVRAATATPARALGRAGELGTLAVGAAGDATVLELARGTFRHVDAMDEVIEGEEGLVNRGVVLAGSWWQDGEPGR
jgi:dihydroorotase